MRSKSSSCCSSDFQTKHPHLVLKSHILVIGALRPIFVRQPQAKVPFKQYYIIRNAWCRSRLDEQIHPLIASVAFKVYALVTAPPPPTAKVFFTACKAKSAAVFDLMLRFFPCHSSVLRSSRSCKCLNLKVERRGWIAGTFKYILLKKVCYFRN